MNHFQEFVFIEKSQRPKCNFESLQFPFCIVFNSEMEITHTGEAGSKSGDPHFLFTLFNCGELSTGHTLMTILKDLVGQVMTGLRQHN